METVFIGLYQFLTEMNLGIHLGQELVSDDNLALCADLRAKLER